MTLILIFPAGIACPGETPQELAMRRLTDRPRKASAWNGSQQRRFNRAIFIPDVPYNDPLLKMVLRAGYVLHSQGADKLE